MTLSVFRFVMEVLFLLPFFLFWARFVDEFFSFVASEVESAHVGRVIRQIYIFCSTEKCSNTWEVLNDGAWDIHEGLNEWRGLCRELQRTVSDSTQFAHISWLLRLKGDVVCGQLNETLSVFAGTSRNANNYDTTLSASVLFKPPKPASATQYYTF